MDTCFHQLDLKVFNDRIPGALPTPADRAGFLKPNVDVGELSGRAIGAELARTIRSVLDASEAAHRLAVLYTPCERDHGERKGADSSSRNDSQPATNQSIFGHNAWLGLSIAGEVKSLDNEVCAFYMDPAMRSKALCVDSPASEGPAVDLEGSNAEDDAAQDVVDGGAYINHTYEGEVGLDRLSESMLRLLTVQHRLFAYSFYVKWKWARVLYFDRAGVLVSESFDWTEVTSLLHDVVWKVAHMTPEQLGHDPTALVAPKSDLEKLRSKMEDPSLPAEVQQYLWKAFRCRATQPAKPSTTNSGDPQATTAKKELELPIYRLTMTSSDSPPDKGFTDAPHPPSNGSSSSRANTTERTFLVGRPHVAADSVIGRCIQVYIAFDLRELCFCLLKDCWRPLIPGQTRPEHWVYNRLRQHEVPGLATPICGGDVGGPCAQITAVQDAMPPEKQLVPHVHYRIATKEVGLPLTEFRSFTELTSIVGGALTAHCAAWEKARILHCNVDVGSILINPKTREGMLVDWEVSRVASELEDGSMKPDPTWTWRSRSALSLFYPRKPYRLSDDIEAFVHVFRYLVLRFHRTWLSRLREYVHGYFEQRSKVGGFRVGGQRKMDSFQTEKPPFSPVGNPHLQALLDRIAYFCHHEFYKLVDMDVMEDKYGVLKCTLGRPIRRREHDDEPGPDEATEAFCAKMGWSDVSVSITRPPPAFKKVDACEIETGFLADHSKLRSLFKAFHSGLYDKHEDQFQARASEEPIRVIQPARSSMQSHGCRRGLADGAQVAIVAELPAAAVVSRQDSPPLPCANPDPSSQPVVATAVSAPSATSTVSPSTRILRKHNRAQEHTEVAEGADDRGNDRSGGTSSSKKRRKNT